MFGSQFVVTAQQLVYDSAHCSVFRKEQSKHVLSNTHRLTLFMYLGMFDVISLINLGFWSEPCTQHILTLWGQLCLFSLKWKCQSLSYVSPPLSRVLVKHVISARACKGCVCVRAHERMCYCVYLCVWVCVHMNAEQSYNLTSRGPSATAVLGHMATHDETAWTVQLKSMSSQQQPHL